MIRAVLFDLDNTLFNRAATFRRYASGLLERRVPEEQRYAVLEKMVLSDERNQHRDFTTYSENMTRNITELQMSAEEYCADYVPGLMNAIEPDLQTRELLLRIAQRFKIGLITNGGSQRQREKIQRLRFNDCFMPEAILISDEVGVTKPSPEIFLRGISAVGCAPEETVFCGDDPERDIAGAMVLGLQTCWVFGMRTTRTFPQGLRAPVWQVEHVEEVERLLQ
jgi:HAD superfamily hydrolase (TIGR01549 family)